jgi:hypothetical protein
MMGLTEELVQLTIRKLTEMIISEFPGIQIIFSIGNHDFEPANVQKFYEGEKTDHLEKIALWTSTLDDPDGALSKFRQFGFYSTLARPRFKHEHHEKRPLRIISINTQSSYILNTGILGLIADAGSQLKWIED